MTAAMLLPATWMTLQHDRLATTTDTRILAQRWLEENAAGARVVAEGYRPAHRVGRHRAAAQLPAQHIATVVEPATVQRLVCNGTRYLVLSNLTTEREIARRAPTTGKRATRCWRAQAEPSPPSIRSGPATVMPAHLDDTGIPFWNLDAYARPAQSSPSSRSPRARSPASYRPDPSPADGHLRSSRR